MPEAFRRFENAPNDHEFNYDRSPVSSHTKKSTTYHTIRRYHVNVGRGEDSQANSPPSNLKDIPRSERFISRSEFPPTAIKPELQSGPDHAQSINHLLERKHENGYLNRQHDMFAKPLESTRDFRQTDNLIEKHTSFLDPSDRKRYQENTQSYHNCSESIPKPIKIETKGINSYRNPSEKALISSSLPTDLREGPKEHPRQFTVPHRYPKGELYSDLDDSNREYVTHNKSHRREHSKSRSNSLLKKDIEKIREKPDHRTKNIFGSAALGAIGAEVISIARNLCHDHHDGRSRARSITDRNESNSIKPALGIAATGLAVAAAAQYAQSRKTNAEDLPRGSSRTRSRSRSYSHQSPGQASRSTCQTSPSKHRDPDHRASVIAKAGVAAAALTGVVQHIRNRSRSRSRSRIRTGTEIAGSALAGVAAADIYERHKEKEESELDEKTRGRDRRERSRYRSRSRARARERSRSSPSEVDSESDKTEYRKEHHQTSKHRNASKIRSRSRNTYRDLDIESELDMIEYGSDPVYAKTAPLARDVKYDHDAATYGAGRNRDSSRRRRNSSSHNSRHSGSLGHSLIRDSSNVAASSKVALVGANGQHSNSGGHEVRRDNSRRYDESY